MFYVGGFINVKYIAVASRASKLPISKVRPLQNSNPGPPREPLNIGKLCSSRGSPGFKSWRSQTLEIGNFEALEVTAMYFTFLETSNLFLSGQERSRA